MSQSNLISQKLCQVPSSDHPLTVKSTATADESATSGNVTTVLHYGARIGHSQPAGEYNTGLVYTAVTNT
jgi:hypothetical protein